MSDSEPKSDAPQENPPRRGKLVTGLTGLIVLAAIPLTMLRMFRNTWTWIAIIAILAAFLHAQSAMLVRAYGEPDPDGYLQMARAFASGELGTFSASDPYLFQDHFWIENPRGEIVCKFAPGYPALLAITRLIFGEASVFMLNPVLGALTIVATFKLFRIWMSPLASVLAVLAFSASLYFAFYTTMPLTHAADACVTAWGMYYLWRFIRPVNVDPLRSATPSLKACLFGGLFLGFAIAVRPINILLSLPLGFAILVHLFSGLKNRAIRWRPVFVLLAAYAVFPLLLALYQWRMFGGPFTSGYSLSGDSQAFLTQYFSNRMPRYLIALRDFVGLPFLVGAVGLMLVGPTRDRLMRALWVIPPLVLHGFYYWDQPNFHWNLRLLIPTLIAYYGAAFAFIDRDEKRWLKVPVMIIFCATIMWLDRGTDPTTGRAVTAVLWKPEIARPHIEATQRLNEVVAAIPENATVFADAPSCFYLSSRRNFSIYNTFTFRNGPHFRKPKPGRPIDWEPKQQPNRAAAIKQFYDTTPEPELTKAKIEKIDALMAAHIPVRFFIETARVEAEQQSIAPKYSLVRVPLELNRELELYEVIPTPPVVRRETSDR